MSGKQHTSTKTVFTEAPAFPTLPWTRWLLPLTSFWIVLLTGVIGCLALGSHWLTGRAAQEADPALRQHQQMMWDVRLLTSPPETGVPHGRQAPGPLAQAVARERSDRPVNESTRP